MADIIEPVVDLLPRRLWRPLNMYVGGRLHFCVGSGRRSDDSVRTIEWKGRVVARGRAPFPSEWWDAEMQKVEERLDQE